MASPPAPFFCDVLVVGGGAAGVAAAAAAGRAGRRVFLLERYGFLGGLATAAQVGTLCGLFLRDTTRSTPIPVAGGFALDFASRLRRAAGSIPLRLKDGLWVLPYPTHAFDCVADALLRELDTVTVARHATVAQVLTEGARIVEVLALAWSEPLKIRPTTVVDCTGEATTVALAGCEVEDPDDAQSPALVFTLENLEPGFSEHGLIEVRRELARAVAEGLLPAVCQRLALVPGSESEGRQTFKLNLLSGPSGQPRWQRISQAEQQGRQVIDQLHRFLIASANSCRRARLASIAPQLGVRSGRRIRGRATLTDDDVLGAKKSAHGIARGAWPMERWADSPRPEMRFFGESDYYEVPLDCLLPAALENVLTAGRGLSASAGAMSSARVLGTALATGWAAGIAASFQALGRPIDQALDPIRKQLSQ